MKTIDYNLIQRERYASQTGYRSDDCDAERRAGSARHTSVKAEQNQHTFRRKRNKRYLQPRRRRQLLRLTMLCLIAVIICGCMTAWGNEPLSEVIETHQTPIQETEVPAQTQKQEQNSKETEVPPQTQEQEQNLNWNLILINPWNKLPGGYSIATVQLKNGLYVDKRCYPDLQDMMDACRAYGLSPVICSAYRSWEKQNELFSNRVSSFISQGYSRTEAEKEAGKVVAVPGTSEHQTGLALDIVDINNQHLDESQEQTPVQQWLMENSWKYGFILRYPNDKSDITGIIYEPWHYRYVGKKAAKEIYEQGICLEEYLEQTK